MIITKLSDLKDSFAVEVSNKLNDVYKEFEDTGEIMDKEKVEDEPKTEEEKATKAVDKLNETCGLLEGTKFDQMCDLIVKMIEQIGIMADENVSIEVNESDDVEEAVQEKIEKEEEKFEMPRARWGHD